MSSILTNNSSMVALETLRNINRNLETVQNEISTGKKVASAKDNASIWAISTVMSTDVESFKQIGDSLNKGNATVGVARAASEQITGLLQDMKELIVDAQQDLNDSDRAKIQEDVAAIRSTITNIVNGAQMNGQNLLKGTDALKVLASLDRDTAGDVKPAFISVNRVDLSTAAGTDAEAKATDDAGYISTETEVTTEDTAKEDGAAGTITVTGDTDGTIDQDSTTTLTIKGGQIAVGDKWAFSVGGADIEVVAEEGDTTVTIAGKIRSAIDDATTTNLGATTGGVDADDPLTEDSTIIITATGGDATFDTSTIETTYSKGVIEAEGSVVIDIVGGTVSEGDTFTVNVGGEEITYTAADGDTQAEVAAGLKSRIDAAEIEGLSTEVGEDGDNATLTLTASDAGSIDVNLGALASTNVAVAGGGLAALSTLSVSTAAEATTALGTIDDLLDKAISAATTFGSGQKQIEGQNEFVQNLVDSMTSGIGSMVDADIEAASAKLQALQVQQQLGVQALSIANSAPQTLLSLFR